MANMNNGFDLLGLEKNKTSRDLSSYLNLIMGSAKIGKSSLCAKLGGDTNLFIATEKGYKTLDVFAIDLTKWSDTGKLLRELKKPEVKERFKSVTIDTVDLLYGLAEKYILQINGITDLSALPFGKAYGEVDKIFNDFLLTLIREGYGIYFISHTKKVTKVIELPNGEKREIEYVTSSMAKRAYQIVSKMVDNQLLCDIEYDENGVERRILRCRAGMEWEAGTRFKYMPDKILLDADTLIKTMQEAIDREENTTDEKVETVSLDNTIINFDDIKEKLITIVTDKFAPNDLMNIVTQITEKHLGIGSKVFDAQSYQAPALQLIYDDLVTYAENNNIK